MHVDPAPLATAEAADRGRACPTVRLFLGDQVVVETPVRSRGRFDGDWEVWTDEVWAPLDGSARPKRRHGEERDEH
jgi:hypothetical protein